jgi:hypothetical protein
VHWADHRVESKKSALAAQPIAFPSTFVFVCRPTADNQMQLSWLGYKGNKQFSIHKVLFDHFIA